MEKPAATDHPIHELLRERWSPRAFADRGIEPEVLRSLLEAARWAPSSYNEQPWAFAVARREDVALFERALGSLVPGNQSWAQGAAVLMLTFAKGSFEHNGKPNRHAFHDVGLAVAQLTFEATSRGLVVHQMAGIERDRIREVYEVAQGWQPATALAVGYPADAASLSEEEREKEGAPRRRKPLAEFVFGQRFGETSSLVS